ncbi:ATP-binding cassette sub-family G member 1-like isoform X2 [Bombus affinis]|uniref:ATP-binding cassette sub-family G member 1 isoform X2 n=1 Tax=Bombus terrestris TaxID=30195 RepID=A0A9B7CWV6_BOMTE|nr:ATP-binding cassette sub-family G member 1 isoform X2 [Bombus terrestris]XP_050582046.1 ATP-binding cassette sub-family G member 1-like isoform X2 [Bombus affinis]
MKTGREKTELLKNLSGEFRAGELTAIMGLSGAGKSTLMDVLTGFTTTGVTGNIMVNSKARNLNEFRRLLAYIMQNDNLQPLLTVQEAMNVAADLKLTTSPQQKKQKIDQILITMSLDTCRHTRTGKLSGGERKRLAIALELINSPPILFLDEPTSGLDSVTSKYCITLLKQLAKAGQTVICSIHQPSASLLNMIDHLYVVADGNCVYSGSTQNLVPYLSSLGLQCPTHYNPADYLMEICNGDYGRYLPQMVNAIENGKNNAWRSISNVTNVNHQEEVIALNVTASFQALRQRSPMEIQHVYGKHKAGAGCAIGFWKQLFILLKRNAIRLSRDKVLTFTRLSMHFVIALIVGVIYFKIGQDAVYVLDNFNLLFFNIMFLMFSAFSATVTTFPSELPIIMREHFNRWYKLHSFYLANKLADIPIQFTAISLYILIVYYMSDQLLELQRFCLYTLMCFAVSIVAQTFGLLVGTGMKVQHGMIFGPLTILPFLIFSGFFVQFRDAHPYLRWLFHLSFLKYGFEGVMIAIYGYDRPKLSCSDVYCHFAIPETLLNAVDMKQANYWFCLIVLVALYIALDIGTYTLLKYKLEKRV